MGGGLGVFKVILLGVILLGGLYIMLNSYKAPAVNPNVYVSSQPPEHAISVSATVTREVTPDLLNIQISVKTRSPTDAKTAQQENAVVVAELLPKLKALGLTDADIQTTSYSVDPQYSSDYVCDKPTGYCRYESNLTGYLATQVLVLDVKDLTKGGDIIDAAAGTGVNQTFVDYTSFTLQDSTRMTVQKSLLQEASAEAKSKAQNIASGLGVSLGQVLSASESNYYYPQPVYRELSMSAGSAAPAPPTQLSAGQVEVSTTVSTSFAVQPAGVQ